MTPLEKTLKRTLRIDGRDYVVTLDPDALKITEKGRRLGLELQWADLISGETALARALQASVGKLQSDSRIPSTRKPAGKRPPGDSRRSRLDKPSR
jgi:hypothetical protein